MVFNWNDENNDYLKKTRGISFEDIVIAIENGDILDILDNPSPKYNNQLLLVVEFNDYVYVVPAVKTGNEYFLKTIFPSRKYTSKHQKNKN